MKMETLLVIGALGIGLFFFLKGQKAAAAAPAPAAATTRQPGQTSMGNPMAGLLIGLAAGFAGTQMAQSR